LIYEPKPVRMLGFNPQLFTLVRNTIALSPLAVFSNNFLALANPISNPLLNKTALSEKILIGVAG
jgi:hypothetical protein